MVMVAVASSHTPSECNELDTMTRSKPVDKAWKIKKVVGVAVYNGSSGSA